MLQTIDLDAKLGKEEYKQARDALDLHLSQLQRDIRNARIPVIVVFEGWEASGIGTAISRLLGPLDPRGYKSHTFGKPGQEAAFRPPMWRFWVSLPAAGDIAVYDGSWYRHILDDKKKSRELDYERYRIFERQLIDDGAVIVKFWLHVGKEEQARRFRKLEKSKALAWKVTKKDWRRNQHYDAYMAIADEMIAETSTAQAPWTSVPAHDNRYATVRIAETFVAAMENALAAKKRPPAPMRKESRHLDSPLDSADMSVEIDRATYERQLPKLQKKLAHLEAMIYVPRIPVVIVYEGWDASGKGGNIKRLVASLDHRGFEVTPVGAPEGEEKTHHYLWRFWRNVPKAGHITIFDRSWYGRVLVERVENFARPDEWQRAYAEINEFEHELASFGTVLVKFWINISKDEQLRRFKARQEIAYKQWKITPDDWRNRDKWDAYHKAVSDMIQKTSTPCAPWTIVEGNCKLHARLKTLSTVINAISTAVK
jgi:polyphosphate:AMP phosphotransferase